MARWLRCAVMVRPIRDEDNVVSDERAVMDGMGFSSCSCGDESRRTVYDIIMCEIMAGPSSQEVRPKTRHSFVGNTMRNTWIFA